MKKVIIRESRKAEVIEVPKPAPVADWALVKITVAPMCTEYKIFKAGGPAEFLGHEAVGEVVETAMPGRARVGERVIVMPQYPCGVCDLCCSGDYIYCENTFDFDSFTGGAEGKATYAQYLLKPSWLLWRIPNGISDECASLALCALGPSFGAFDRMRLSAFDRVLITGAGPVGLGAVVNAKFLQARVVVVESNPYRVEKAYALGADLVIDPADDEALARVRQWSGGEGVDACLDCSGVVPAQRFCIESVRRRGQVAIVGECHDSLPIKASPDLLRKGLTILGSWHYNLSLTSRVLQVIAQSPSVSELVSHVFPMSQIQRAFEVSASQQCAKILLKPWE
jgi:threonine dehydrogenase-like Zn-dependent dehydrogenase